MNNNPIYNVFFSFNQPISPDHHPWNIGHNWDGIFRIGLWPRRNRFGCPHNSDLSWMERRPNGLRIPVKKSECHHLWEILRSTKKSRSLVILLFRKDLEIALFCSQDLTLRWAFNCEIIINSMLKMEFWLNIHFLLQFHTWNCEDNLKTFNPLDNTKS